MKWKLPLQMVLLFLIYVKAIYLGLGRGGSYLFMFNLFFSECKIVFCKNLFAEKIIFIFWIWFINSKILLYLLVLLSYYHDYIVLLLLY